MTLYLDTSSLVKLYVTEPGSDAVRKLVDDATVVATSSIAYTETRAALARRHRDRGLRPAAFALAKKTFETDWPSYFTVDVTSACVARQSSLRNATGCGPTTAYISLHSLKSPGRPGCATPVSSFDEALNRAARLLGRALIRAR